MPGIDFVNVNRTYDKGSTFAVRDLNLNISNGEFLVLLGSSGSGKTTTLKMINRLIEPSSGSITIDGVNVCELDVIALRRSVGYVFQEIGLFPHMTIEENVGLVPNLMGWSYERRCKRAHDLLELVGLPPAQYAQRLPDQLSGGQQQRVGVARALAVEPQYLLMDEPFGAVDPLTRDNLQQQILQLHRQLKKTIVFVTHDIFEALTLGDRIAIFHSGNLEQVGTKAEILSTPATAFVRSLFEKPAQQLQLYGDMM